MVLIDTWKISLKNDLCQLAQDETSFQEIKADANWQKTKHPFIWLVLSRRGSKFPNNDLFQLEQDQRNQKPKKKFVDHMSSNHFQTFMVRSKFIFTRLNIIALSNPKNVKHFISSHHKN